MKRAKEELSGTMAMFCILTDVLGSGCIHFTEPVEWVDFKMGAFRSMYVLSPFKDI